jgi:hypothetical protein
MLHAVQLIAEKFNSAKAKIFLWFPDKNVDIREREISKND